MRRLALLTLVFMLARCVVAQEAPRSNAPAPPGAIRLIPEFQHERLQGVDSNVGRIWKEKGLEIRYDIGRMAGNRAAAIKAPDREWAVSQIVNGHPVEIVKSKDGFVTVTFADDFANFFAKVSGEQDVAALLAIAFTYPAAPASK